MEKMPDGEKEVPKSRGGNRLKRAQKPRKPLRGKDLDVDGGHASNPENEAEKLGMIEGEVSKENSPENEIDIEKETDAMSADFNQLMNKYSKFEAEDVLIEGLASRAGGFADAVKKHLESSKNRAEAIAEMRRTLSYLKDEIAELSKNDELVETKLAILKLDEDALNAGAEVEKVQLSTFGIDRISFDRSDSPEYRGNVVVAANRAAEYIRTPSVEAIKGAHDAIEMRKRDLIAAYVNKPVSLIGRFKNFISGSARVEMPSNFQTQSFLEQHPEVKEVVEADEQIKRLKESLTHLTTIKEAKQAEFIKQIDRINLYANAINSFEVKKGHIGKDIKKLTEGLKAE
jgi:hypothetical protein